MFLKQSTIQTVLVGPLLSASDGVTPVTTGLGTVYVSKAGAAQAARSSATAITHDRDGYYRVALDATDSNTRGELVLQAAPAGALPVWQRYTVLAAPVYDALVAATANLPTAVASMGADVLTAAALAADAVGEIQSGLLTAAGYTAPPSAASIAQAVWEYVTRTLTSAGSGGGATAAEVWSYASRTLSTAPPTASEIATAVWAAGSRTLTGFGALVSDVATAVWGAAARTLTDGGAGGGVAGPGATLYTHAVTDSAGYPLDGVAVWVSTDAAGTNVVAGTRYTDDAGTVTFLLDAGSTYYVWKQRAGFTFTNPEEVTV